MHHYIYKVKSKSGKYYIGRHSTENLEDNYLGSGTWVRGIKDKSILDKEILEFCNTFEDLLIAEKNYIQEHINDVNCMNFNNESVGFASGDLNPSKSPDERLRRSIRAKTNNPASNKDVAEKISKKLKGRPNPRKGIPLSEAARMNISNSRKGIKYSKEGKQKISEVRKRDYESGHRGVPSFKGLSHTDETKSKQRAAALNRKKVKCPHCGKEGAINVMNRWHFNNCNNK